MSRRLAYGLAALALIALVGWQASRWFGADSPAGEAVVIGGPFSLTASDGRRVTDQDFRGRWMLIYFGFTFCPDVCPTELAVMAAALDALGDDAADIQPILITLDQERDTVEVLRDYVAAFHPRLIGLTGTLAEIQAVAGAYRVFFQKTEPDASGDYVVDHSSVVYLMDPAGDYVAVFGRDVDAVAMAEGLRHYLD
ncbi:MAG: SCO family protein [Alphaproteobacteria bacterium]|nr:SCO family protein [Alphaproteobacteria bacterium]